MSTNRGALCPVRPLTDMDLKTVLGLLDVSVPAAMLGIAVAYFASPVATEEGTAILFMCAFVVLPFAAVATDN